MEEERDSMDEKLEDLKDMVEELKDELSTWDEDHAEEEDMGEEF